MIKKILYLTLILLILVALVYFSIQNNEITSVNILQYRIDLTVGYLCIVVTIVGMLFAALLLLPYAFIQRVHILRLRSQCKKLTKRLNKEHSQVEIQGAIIEEQGVNIDELRWEVNEKEKTGMIQSALLTTMNLMPGKKSKKADNEMKNEDSE